MYKAIYFLLSFLFLTAAHSESAFCPPVSVLVKKDPAGFVKSTRMLYAIDSRGLSPTLKGAAMQSLLTGVHPLLGDPRKECIAKLDDYELQILPEITDDMLFDLMAIIPSDNRHGFGILSSPFWSSVQKVQRSGIKVGWILRSPYPVNGVYLGSHDVIGLNPAADIPTLAHEFRHYAQAHYFDYRDPIQNRLNDLRAARAFSDTCLVSLRRYFGELDATNEDIAYWKDYLVNALEIVKDKELFLNSQFPQLALLQVNLNYPAQLTAPVTTDTSCPTELRTMTKEIKPLLHTELLTSKAARLANRLTQAQTLLKTNLECVEGKGKSSACDRFRLLLSDAEAIRAELSSELIKYSSERKLKIRDVLKKLPEAQYYLWCEYNASFRFMAGCEEPR